MGRSRLIAGLLVGTTVFVGAFGMPATLGTVNADSLGAADEVIAACDTVGGISTSYTTAYDATAPGYELDELTVGSIDDTCDGLTLKVTLVNGSNASLGELTGTIGTGAGTTHTLDFTTTNVPAESIAGVHVVISG